MTLIQQLTSETSINQASPEPISIAVEAIPRGVAATPIEDAVGDSEFLVSTGVSTWDDYLIFSGNLEDALVFENLNPSVATLSGELVTRLTDGLCRVKASRGGASRSEFLSFTQNTSGEFRELTGYVANSKTDIFSTSLLDLVDDDASSRYYSTVDQSSGVYTRNAACWAASLDLSGLAVGSDTASASFSRRSPAALIDDGTRRHVVGAAHWNVYYPSFSAGAGWVAGTKLRFANSSGDVFERTVMGVAYFADIAVATLSAALPESVAAYKIAGDWIAGTGSQGGDGLWRFNFAGAAFHMDQNMDCRFILLGSPTGVGHATKLTGTVNGSPVTAYDAAYGMSRATVLAQETLPDFLTGKTNHMREATGGDSGNQLMVLIEDEPALLWGWTGPTSGTPLWTAGLIAGVIADADADAGVTTMPTVVYATDPTT